MPVTSIEGPHTQGANAGATVTIGGTDFTQVAQVQYDRVKEGSTGSATGVLSSNDEVLFMKNFFNDNQIPSGATIDGIEIVAGTDFDGSGNGYIGSSGGSSGGFKIRAFLYNGTAFSSALEHKQSVDSISGITSTDSGTSLTWSGASRFYANNSTGDDILYGADDELSGLSWNASDQAEWGFAITFTEESGTGVGLWHRGIGLRCTYTVSGFSKVICGKASAAKVSNIAAPTSVINIAS